ncbi:MAG TPA: nucleotide exchange factor GrpE [Syntrophomonadaceae bacterium]|nr:nucleotide exchange factor GrpE [Syntrophomonadaceae bacterium]HRX20097.1 nucleotide exchange factor GrpE [Syntrophomonadaceae bacterium]
MTEKELDEVISNSDEPELSPEQDEIKRLETELAKSQDEAQKNRDLYLRLLADVENMKKRTVREREEYIQFATLPVIKKILSAVDDLERALDMSAGDQNYEALYKGVEMINNSLHEMIKAEGVEPIDALGKPFDPQFHQPLTVETGTGHEENTVIEELQRGYTMKGRVIRPSLVKVSG